MTMGCAAYAACAVCNCAVRNYATCAAMPWAMSKMGIGP